MEIEPRVRAWARISPETGVLRQHSLLRHTCQQIDAILEGSGCADSDGERVGARVAKATDEHPGPPTGRHRRHRRALSAARPTTHSSENAIARRPGCQYDMAAVSRGPPAAREAMSTTAGLLIIGNEILSGKVQDANSPYLCRELRALGVEVKRISVIPDDVEAIASEVAVFAATFDIVITTGGVGPTHDDVTVEGIARGLGRPVIRHPDLERLVHRLYPGRVNDARLRLAHVPEGAQLVGQPDLVFPVVVIQNIYVFPGVPEILRQKFESIKERFRDSPFYLRKVFVTASEAAIAEHLNAVVREYPDLLLGSYPELHNPEYRVRLTLESKDPAYLDSAFNLLMRLLPASAVARVE
jgi:molybdenum cofactor synthesis domain-containing protein